MISSRGCPYNCTFCTAPKFYKNRFKPRSPEKVVEEMELLINDYGIETIIMQDENITCDMKRMERILDIIIEKNLKIEWFAEVGLSIRNLSYEIIEKMKKAGFSELRLAVESGDAQTLKKIKKPVEIHQIRNVVKWIREFKLRAISFLLIGLPGETFEQMNNTVNFADELGFDWNIISFALPIPGSKIYENLIAKGCTFDYLDFERYTSPVEGVAEIPAERLIKFKEEANVRLNFENNYNLTRGDVFLAIKDFENLTKKYPDLEKAYYYLGIAYYKAIQYSKALDSFNHIISINKNFKNTLEWIEYLKDKRFLDKDKSYIRDMEIKLNYFYGE